MYLDLAPEDVDGVLRVLAFLGIGGNGAALRAINERLDRQGRTLTRIERKQDLTMGLVAIEQGDLDSIAVTITQVAETLQAVLDSDTPLSPADESGVQDALTKLKAVGPRVPTDPAPVPDPAPVDETPAPVDETPVPDQTPVDTTPPQDPTPVAEDPSVTPDSLS